MVSKHLRNAIVLISLSALAAAGCGRGQSSAVIAKVDGRPITQNQLYEALEQVDNGDAGRRALDSLIVRQLVQQEADKRSIKIDQQQLQARINALTDYVLAGTGKTFEAWLQDAGETQQDVTNRLRVQMLTAKLVLTDEERKQYFEANKSRLKEVPHNNESVIYRQIVVATKAEAEAVRSELERTAAGKPVTDDAFAKVAEERSLDPMTRARGGMRGWWIKGKGDGMEKPTPEVESVLFALKPGELSQPVALKPPQPPAAKGATPPQQPEPWRILLVDKHIAPHEISLAGNEDIIEEWMLGDPRFQFEIQQFFENLRAKANVEVLSPRYRAVGEAYQRRREMREKMPGAPPMMLPQPPAGGPQQAPPAPQGGRSERSPGR